MDFIVSNLSIKSTVPALELFDNGELKSNVDGKICLESQASGREELPNVLVGPDSVPTLSFSSGSEGRPKGVQGRHLRVIANVRAEDAAVGLNRLESTTKAYGLWSPAWITTSRLEVVFGDISKPQLSLCQNFWHHLLEEVDIVIHNGAQVNWMLPYSRLQAANVLSTLACIRLCAAGKPKRLAFVSSTSTLDNENYVHFSQEIGTAVLETDDLEGSRKGLGTGYGQSRWASEFIVREAGRRGLVGAIIRPGYITGDPGSGISVTDDFLIRLWKGFLQVGAHPKVANAVNTVPVMQVSRIVVAAVLHLPAAIGQSLGVAQITSHPRLTLNE